MRRSSPHAILAGMSDQRVPDRPSFDPYGERAPRARAVAVPRSDGSIAAVVFWAVAALLVAGRLAVSVEAPVQAAFASAVQAIAAR